MIINPDFNERIARAAAEYTRAERLLDALDADILLGHKAWSRADHILTTDKMAARENLMSEVTYALGMGWEPS